MVVVGTVKEVDEELGEEIFDVVESTVAVDEEIAIAVVGEVSGI